MQELARLINIFNKLNPLFDEIQTKYKFLRSPTLTGVQQLRKESVNTINTLVSRIKSEVQYRTGIQSRGKSLDDVLKDPAFIAMKKKMMSELNKKKPN